MVEWIFFDVGSTLVDEAAAYDHRVRDMISGTSITFQEFDNARIAFAKQGLDGNSAAIRHFGFTKTPWHAEDEVPYSTQIHTTHWLLSVVKGINLGSLQIRISEQPNAWSFGVYGGSLA